ncbi:MAG: NADAR family protein [Thermoanaerobaculia bacterium]|nr:NADAR family protein [Thermoanaerobaculia bacterium]
MTNLDDLRAQWRSGRRPTFFMFWGHRAVPAASVGRWCLSQWWPAPFAVDGVAYPTAEHFMMASKARLFDDADAYDQILANPDPAHAKAVGRLIRGFDEHKWRPARYGFVVEGNLAKFRQNSEVRGFLLSIREDIFVEASPTDTVWGIGLRESDPAALDPEKWRGLNLLGFALVEVRRRIQLDGLVHTPVRG